MVIACYGYPVRLINERLAAGVYISPIKRKQTAR
jgi:hypothetical protein